MEILVHTAQDWLKNLKLPFKFPFMCNLMMYIHIQGFPDGSNGKEPACNAEDLGSIPG